MKSIRNFVSCLIIISLVFLFALYFYFESAGEEYPLKEALSFTLSFIGSIGTIASLIFALYFYNSQSDEQKNIIKSNQPLFQLSTSDLKKSKDSTGQPSFTLYVNVKNFGHLASSFSLVNIGLPENLGDKIIIEIQNYNITLFNRDDSYDFELNIFNSNDIQLYPNMENARFDLLLSYVDKFNSSHFKVYSLSFDKNKKPKLKFQNDHHLLTFNK